MPVKIQLAIQGGGAKIAALMATLEAVDALQTHGVLKVTRIAGTSAGAIVGAVYAAGPGKITLARNRLIGIPPEKIKKMFPPAMEIFRLYRLFRKGAPLWQSKDIKKLLGELLEHE